MKAWRIWPKPEIPAVDARSFHLKKLKYTMSLEQNKRMKCASAVQLLVFECHPVSFITPATQPIYLIVEHVRLSSTLIA